MLPKPEPACFVIADISGYTSFLAEVSAASNPELSRYHAGETNSYVMTNLHQVIDHGAR